MPAPPLPPQPAALTETRDATGRLLCRVEMVQKRPHGAMEAATADGLSARMSWQNGVLHGPLTARGSDGARSAMQFVNGMPQGPMTLHGANGKLSATATLVAGKLHGPMTLYGKTGRPERRLHYRDGVLVGNEPLTLAGKLKHWLDRIKG